MKIGTQMIFFSISTDNVTLEPCYMTILHGFHFLNVNILFYFKLSWNFSDFFYSGIIFLVLFSLTFV